jgi:hypothetical protein
MSEAPLSPTSSPESTPSSALSSAPDLSVPPSIPAPQPVQSPQPTVSIPDNWKESLPEEMRSNPTIKNVSSLKAMAEMLLHSQSAIGANKIAIPGKNATEEDWKQVYHKLGLPESVENYKLDLPNGHNFDEGFVTQLRDNAYKAGILPAQLNKILSWYHSANNEALAKMDKEYTDKIQDGLSQLRKEFGQAWDEKISYGKRALSYFAEKNGLDPKQVFTWVDATGMGDDPMMIKLMAFMGGLLREDKIIGSEFIPQGMAPGDIDKEINQLMADPAYLDKSHPNHKKAVDDMQRFFAMKHPDQRQQMNRAY